MQSSRWFQKSKSGLEISQLPCSFLWNGKRSGSLWLYGMCLGKHAHAQFVERRIAQALECLVDQLLRLVDPGIAGRAERQKSRAVSMGKPVPISSDRTMAMSFSRNTVEFTG